MMNTTLPETLESLFEGQLGAVVPQDLAALEDLIISPEALVPHVLGL